MGYIGQRMSERAASAYDMGEKPLSKWKKSNIIERLKELVALGELEATAEQLKQIEKLSLKTLKVSFLRSSSWHHTGKYYNETNFYDVDIENVEKTLKNSGLLETLEENDKDLKKAIREAKAEQAKKGGRWAIICYSWTENRGSKKWARIYECQQNFLAKIKGKAAIITKGWKKDKKVYNYSIVHEFEGKPRKNAKELKLLEDSYSESKRSKWCNY